MPATTSTNGIANSARANSARASSGARRPLAVIFGCASTVLSPQEKAFFRDSNPFGFILFARNIETPDQTKTLVAELRTTIGRDDAPVLIDQEGGRVARLRPPHWRAAPAAEIFGTLAMRDPDAAKSAVVLNARLIACELDALGINVDCAPVVDLRHQGAHAVIGDRSFGADPGLVATLGGAFAEGLLAGGVVPMMKHIPGHGRARMDSHKALPTVSCGRDSLTADFRPFRELRWVPTAMTAHILFTALDPDNPATVSPAIVEGLLRDELGFEGLLVSDDIAMEALSGDFRARAKATLVAGCDVVLHCSGVEEEMRAVVTGCRPLTAEAVVRWERALAAARERREKADRKPEALERQLEEMLV